MKAFRGPKVWLWRWRRNPLRRRADLLEGWVVVAVWLLTALTGVLAGLGSAGSVERGLARERADWQPAAAQLLARAPGRSADTGDDGNGDADGGRVWARVRWTVPDGSAHTGRTRVEPGSAAGTTVTVWTDSWGHLVSRPTTPAEATFRATLVGGLVGLSAAAVPLVAGEVLRGRMERRRLDRWQSEWARLGPQWRRMPW